MVWNAKGGQDTEASTIVGIFGGSSEGACIACPQGYSKPEIEDVAWEAPCIRSGEDRCPGPSFELSVYVDELFEEFEEIKHRALTETIAQYLEEPRVELTSGVSCRALYLMSIQNAESITHGLGCHPKFEFEFMVKHGGAAALKDAFGVQVSGTRGSLSTLECPLTYGVCDGACQWGKVLDTDAYKRGVIVTYKVQSVGYDSGLVLTKKLDVANGESGLVMAAPNANSQYLSPSKIHIYSVRWWHRMVGGTHFVDSFRVYVSVVPSAADRSYSCARSSRGARRRR
jgi:hypothetical protein